MKKKYFLLDCETGGIAKETSLLTMFGMILNNDLKTQDEISLKIKPNNGIYHIEAGALRCNNIDLVEHEKSAIFMSAAAEQFKDFVCRNSLDGNKLIPTGHNLSIDIDFCKSNFSNSEKSGEFYWDNYFSYRSLDTATIAQSLIIAGKLPEYISCSLKSLSDYFDIDYTGAHEAEFDAKLTQQILILLVGLL